MGKRGPLALAASSKRAKAPQAGAGLANVIHGSLFDVTIDLTNKHLQANPGQAARVWQLLSTNSLEEAPEKEDEIPSCTNKYKLLSKDTLVWLADAAGLPQSAQDGLNQIASKADICNALCRYLGVDPSSAIPSREKPKLAELAKQRILDMQRLDRPMVFVSRSGKGTSIDWSVSGVFTLSEWSAKEKRYTKLHHIDGACIDLPADFPTGKHTIASNWSETHASIKTQYGTMKLRNIFDRASIKIIVPSLDNVIPCRRRGSGGPSSGSTSLPNDQTAKQEQASGEKAIGDEECGEEEPKVKDIAEDIPPPPPSGFGGTPVAKSKHKNDTPERALVARVES